jgi:hypothetical protein
LQVIFSYGINGDDSDAIDEGGLDLPSMVSRSAGEKCKVYAAGK